MGRPLHWRRLPLLILLLAMAQVEGHDKEEVTEWRRGGEEELAWVVQLSDLHFSAYYPDRARSFRTILGPLLSFIKPSLVLITGDLTDAKSKDRKSRRQDEAEWIEYNQTISRVIAESGLPSQAFLDLRGNHDKFGVPEVEGSLDYFSKYSLSAQRNRSGTVQSITLMNRGWKHLFVGIDTSMSIGLRGPCNLFGHPTDEQLDLLDVELSQWDSCRPQKVTKIVFGHFPMSFTASTAKGRRPESVFAKHSISAYVCGHLHSNFGINLVRHHVIAPERLEASKNCIGHLQDENGEFWEWEMGDWRMCRMVRVLAIDQGHVSYVDFNLTTLDAFEHVHRTDLPTLIVPTYPLDSQKMSRLKPHPLSSGLDSVRALVFSSQPQASVFVRFFDISANSPVLQEELEMNVSSKSGEAGYFYVANWNHTKYLDRSPTRYTFQIVAVDASGKETKSVIRHFSVQNSIGDLQYTWREFFVMGFLWEDVCPFLLWSSVTILVVLFILPKFYYYSLVKTGTYNRWTLSLFKNDRKQKSQAQRAVSFCMWFFIQGCSNGAIWWGQSVTLVYLLFFPWFWGQVLAEGYPLGSMSIWGWTIRLDPSLPTQSGLGWPDLMLVVLPYLYFVILPLYFLLFTLSAGKKISEQHILDAVINTKKEQVEDDCHEKQNLLSASQSTTPGGQRSLEGMPRLCSKSSQSLLQKRYCLRGTILAGCLWVAFLHFGQTCALAGAYGVMSLVASPGITWPVPILLITAVLQATACGRSK